MLKTLTLLHSESPKIHSVLAVLSAKGLKERSCSTRMDGWMTCDLMSFLTVFQSYQDDVRMIMKGCVQRNSVYG